MTAEDKKREQKDSKPAVPRNRTEAILMLGIAARNGDVDEISRLARWDSLRDRLFRIPHVINGDPCEEFCNDDHANTDLTNSKALIQEWSLVKAVAMFPLLAALEAPNAKAFLTLMSLKPQYFIDKYPFQLLRSIIWWPLWPREEKLKALEAVWDVLSSKQRDMLKENGSLLKKEDLSDLLKNLTTKPATPKNEREIKVSGDTSLTKATENGQLETVKMLLDQGASTEEIDNEGNTALLIASRAKNLPMMRLLCERGASVKAKNNQGETALTLAAKLPSASGYALCRRAAVTYLITEAGANPGDGLAIAEYLPRSHVPVVAGYPSHASVPVTVDSAENSDAYFPEILKRAAQLKALYDGYLAQQQQIREQIEEVLGEGGTSALINVEAVRQIIRNYATTPLDSGREPTSEATHPQDDPKEMRPIIDNPSPSESKSDKRNHQEFKPMTTAEIADNLNAIDPDGPNFAGIYGWEVGPKGAFATFHTEAERDKAKAAYAPRYTGFSFWPEETNIQTTTSSIFYRLYAAVNKELQTSAVVQPHSSASSNSTPIPSRSGSAGSNYTPGHWQPAGRTPVTNPPATGSTVAPSSSTSTSDEPSEQQPVRAG